ncbi:MAG: hypothetical protein NC432_05285 [Roseburia sp.]|nr:hypothetical protein [Roseburia sp.]MCM1097921.1 hypothetical protein [Ruminococcus flavefaciens]
MKKLKKILASPATTIVAFVLAAGLLLFSSIGGAQAALTAYSENYVSQFELNDIGVALIENDIMIASDGALLVNMLTNASNPEVQDPLKLGKHYGEELKVQNTGTIDQYVRVSVYKYWTEPKKEGAKESDKSQELSPDLIGLLLKGADITSDQGRKMLEENGWLFDASASTEERTVLYYARPLVSGEEGNGEESSLFADEITISGQVAQKVTESTSKNDAGLTVIKTTYAYNGCNFCLEVKVDAVQDHNAEDAILSAWGRKVTIDGNGTLSLN